MGLTPPIEEGNRASEVMYPREGVAPIVSSTWLLLVNLSNLFKIIRALCPSPLSSHHEPCDSQACVV